MRLLVRTWNLFHGRTTPETAETHVEHMVRLVADGADLVCLQEVPVWALAQLGRWSGMGAFAAIAMPALGGPFARRVTAVDPRRLRSALTGQANAILVAPRLGAGDERVVPLNPPSFMLAQARRLRLGPHSRLAWARDRRVGQLVRIDAGGASVVVVNTHLTTARDSRLADAELHRLASYADGYARPREPIVLAGDLNLTRASSYVLPELEQRGFSPAGSGIDHILVRDLVLEREPEPWPDERRQLGERLLSDHAPVEAVMMLR
jgi:endonuclease/exonuclease/phosphatase family metal-dependent hydrolase